MKDLEGNIAEYVGSSYTYHIYNAHCVFAGVVGELISQIPETIKNSKNKFFIVYQTNGFGGIFNELHEAIISYYKNDM